MRIYVFADMEGISGVSCSDFVGKEPGLYQAGRRYLTWDINACVRGCFAGGATEVLVRDGHGGGRSVIWEEVDARAELIQGTGDKRRFPCLEGCAGLILLGYHARAGAVEAVLEHTYSSASIQNCWLNGRPVGEFGIDAAIAGEQGVPTIMVSGDDKVCAEAREWVPGVRTAQVKVGLACQEARMLSRERAHTLIERTTAEAVRQAASGVPAPLRLPPPITCRIEFVERQTLPRPAGRPGLRFVDGRTVEATADTVEAAFYQAL